jgi:acyl-CoA synthetase (AMP-forming)/AMP-acid ligase II
MVHAPDVGSFDLGSLRAVLSGGAPIAPALVRDVLTTFGCEYIQTYGMTETSPFLTLGLLTPAMKGLPEPERLTQLAKTGRPMLGVELEVFGEDGSPVTRDEEAVGEIRVRGATVTPGYRGRPEATQEAFQDGWLRTGDLAVVDAAGFVTIVDRLKDVILTGGETVYSAEVEKVLCAHPAVLETAVFGLESKDWGEVVTAAVVLKAGCEADADGLRAHCRERLAGYKVPREIRLLIDLPRTGSGKIAKRALRERFSDGLLRPL